jgi:hypothetical protein
MTRDPNDFDLDDLGAQWRNTAAPSLDEMHRRLRRQTVRLWATFATELAVAVAGVGASIWLLLRSDVYAIGLGALTLVYTGVATAFSLNARAGVWRNDAKTLVEATDLAIRRAANGVRMAQAGYWMTAVGVVFVAATIVLIALDESASEDRLRRGLYAAAGALVFLVFWVVGCRVYENRRQRELDALRKMREQMLDT